MNGRNYLDMRALPSFEPFGVDGPILSNSRWNGPAGHVEGVNLRLYNPQSRQWSLNFANCKAGTMSVPTVGEFKNGRGEFFAQDTINGKSVLIRFVWTDMTTNSPHFEQSFSDDGGKTWEVNWTTDQTRMPGGSDKSH
jgi:hypothetical protein